MNRQSMAYQQDKEMHDELESKYLAMIRELISQRRSPDDSDARALEALQSEYIRSKNTLKNLVE